MKNIHKTSFYFRKFIGIEREKCFCLDDLFGGMLLSNRHCSSKCSGDAAELCGGKGALSIYKLHNDTHTDAMAVFGNWESSAGTGLYLMEDGNECTSEIPNSMSPYINCYTAIEDHTIVKCGGVCKFISNLTNAFRKLETT